MLSLKSVRKKKNMCKKKKFTPSTLTPVWRPKKPKTKILPKRGWHGKAAKCLPNLAKGGWSCWIFWFLRVDFATRNPKAITTNHRLDGAFQPVVNNGIYKLPTSTGYVSPENIVNEIFHHLLFQNRSVITSDWNCRSVFVVDWVAWNHVKNKKTHQNRPTSWKLSQPGSQYQPSWNILLKKGCVSEILDKKNMQMWGKIEKKSQHQSGCNPKNDYPPGN